MKLLHNGGGMLWHTQPCKSSRCHDVAWTFYGATSSDVMLLCSGINKPVAVLSWYMTAKPTEDYIIIVDADMIIMKPFDPVQMGVKPGAIPTHAA